MMKATLQCVVSAVACWSLQQVLMVAARGEPPRRASVEATRPAETTQSGKAGGTWIPALTGERRPLCRLRKTNALEIDFTFAPAVRADRRARCRTPSRCGTGCQTWSAWMRAFPTCGRRSGAPMRPRRTIPMSRSSSKTPINPLSCQRPDHARRQVQMAGADDRRSGNCHGGGTDRSGQAFASAAVPATIRPTDGSLLAQCEIHHEHPKPARGHSARAGRSDLRAPKLDWPRSAAYRPTVWFLRETASLAEGGGLCPRN